jgi:two-component system sensor histidine kinase SenX3
LTQAGKAPSELGPVEVADVVAEAVDRVRTNAEASGLTIEVGGDRATVIGHHDLLVTSVRNLLDNAIAYSEAGTRIGVGTTVRPDEGTVEIAVVDQGIGIPAEAQPRLFERFYRVDPARSRDTGGTGLGLSIVKHVVADHGGEVTVWSEPGRGSTFTIHLPLPPTELPPTEGAS